MPSSVNPHAPASFNASMSTSSRPFNEREIAAAWKIRISSLEAQLSESSSNIQETKSEHDLFSDSIIGEYERQVRVLD